MQPGSSDQMENGSGAGLCYRRQVIDDEKVGALAGLCFCKVTGAP